MGILIIFLGVRLAGPPPPDYQEWEGREVSLTGKVFKKENLRTDRGPQLILYLHPQKQEGEEKEACAPKEDIICYLKANQKEPETGSTVRVKGKVKTFEKASNPGQFDAEAYYSVLKISFRLYQAEIQEKSTDFHFIKEKLYRLSNYLAGILEKTLPEKEASILKTMLLGQKGELDKEIKGLYQRNGIAHILAISGLHISLLGRGLFKLLKKIGVRVKTGAVLSAAFVLLYGVMSGFSVSSLRAIFMFLLQMTALLAGRSYDMLTAAALSAILILIEQPYYVNHSGFLFSFGCVFALALAVPALSLKKGAPLPAALLVNSLALTTVTLPLYLWFYYQFPPYSLLLNLFVIPMMSLIIAAGLVLLLMGAGGLFFAYPAAMLIIGALRIYEGACLFCGSLPFHLLTPGKPKPWMLFLYFGTLLMVLALSKKIKLGLRWLIIAGAACVFFVPGPKRLTVTFLDVGQGDCIFLRNERGNSYLIDGGSSSQKEVGEYGILPYLKAEGVSELTVFITHPDADHCNGILELLAEGKDQGVSVKTLILPAIATESRREEFKELEEAAQEAGAALCFLHRGQTLTDGKMKLSCLHPKEGEYSINANEYSLVLFLEYGEFSALFTGDIEGMGEKEMLSFLEKRERKDIDVLKAAHHGSGNSTPEDFLNMVRPEYTVISCGKNNSYGHPNKELLERVEAAGSEAYITYQTGAVSFETDGYTFHINKQTFASLDFIVIPPGKFKLALPSRYNLQALHSPSLLPYLYSLW